MLHLQSRPDHRSRPHLKGEHGLCALEDYTCLTGESFVMRSLRAQLRRVSAHFRIALITGESGTCKETVALALHRLRSESDTTFDTYSAGFLPRLFPEDSSMPDAERDPVRAFKLLRREGAFELSELQNSDSDHGTLYLTGIGETELEEQVPIFRAIERIAAIQDASKRPRLIFGTALDLRSLAAAGRFNRELYRVISAVEIVLPPLSSRPEDIPLITSALLSRSARSGEMTPDAFDGRALSRLQCHNWPRNLRELEHVVEIARERAGGGADGLIEAMHLPALGTFARASQPNRIQTQVERLDDVIRNHVVDVLMRCSGNKVRAARRLGISRSTLYRMLEAGEPATSLELEDTV